MICGMIMVAHCEFQVQELIGIRLASSFGRKGWRRTKAALIKRAKVSIQLSVVNFFEIKGKRWYSFIPLYAQS